jgi:2-methylisocitrate lyase-like PEP mutase family enzyme
MMQDNPTVARLKARLDPERPAIAMAAHNPLAAKLAAAAGFDAIWGSGFELSASYAVPDASRYLAATRPGSRPQLPRSGRQVQ